MAYPSKWGAAMNRAELSRFIGITGFSLGQVEKDYFQHIVLSSISRKYAGELVFKGGTALQKMGFVERFSEDLDFTASGMIEIEKIIHLSTEAVSNYNFKTSFDRLRSGEDSSGFRLKIEGPLFHGGKGICTISLDISTRETILLSPELKEYSPVYPNVFSYLLRTMDLREILAEKVRALMTRKRPRDLYDASRLIERGSIIDEDLANKKLEYYGMTFDEKQLLKRSTDLEKIWLAEMKQLLDPMPSHEACYRFLETALNGK